MREKSADTEWELRTETSKQNTYYGYWIYEAGAICKILRLDDEELKEQQYYPYDLVHFNE
ncbi:MAG: PoNe immunity protein domain-containing protein [Coprococcus sp.]